MKRPLCAYVVRGNRFCRAWPAYRDGGKEYCGIHAPKVGATEPILRPRRSLYRTNGSTSIHSISTQHQHKEHAMVTDDLELEVGTSSDDLPDAGVYPATIDHVEPFTGGQYGPAFKFRFRITGGDWDGATVEGIASRPDSGRMTEKTKVFNWYKAAMGEPAVGTKIRLPAMIGRSVQIMVEHKAGDSGAVWARVREVLPPPQPRRRTPIPPPPADDEEDDDLTDA